MELIEQNRAPHSGWRGLGPSDHFVQFYESDPFLVASLADFVGAGLQAGAAAVIIATQAHVAALEDELEAGGWDLATLATSGRYVRLDAAETLAKLLRAGRPDPKRFQELAGQSVARAAEGNRPVRVFGEMVGLLWAEGNFEAAIQLEALWNELRTNHDFALYCAYPIRVGAGEAGTRWLQAVCAEHSRVLPAESYSGLADADERLRAIVLLQHKAQALEAELAERQALEEERARLLDREREARAAAETEVARRVHAEALLTGERSVLEMIARGQPLEETLDALARLIETEADGAHCSIHLLDRDGVHLRHGAAPSLPDAYNQAIDGIAIGPAVGSCGTAAHRREPVVVTDISTDPLWDDFRDVALRHGLHACWSTPIHGSDGRVLGTFALYHREPVAPSPQERELVAVLTYLASIAIERRRHEEERGSLLERERAARAEVETMLGQIADAVMVIDTTGRTTYLNQAAKTLLGTDSVGVPPERRSEVYGLLTAEGDPFQAEDLPSMRAMREKQVITGVDMRIRRPDGTDIPVQENAAPIVAEHGSVVGAIATVRDMSAQHKLERQKEDFLAAAAHDLKNPVAVLQGQAQLLRRRAQRGSLDQEQVMAGLEVIESRARAMTTMIDELMDVTRLRMGEQLQLNRQQTDLTEIVREAVDVQRAVSEGHHLVFEAAEGAFTGFFDTARLARVLGNLLTNAVKFSPEGSEIQVRVQRQELEGQAWAVVAVHDHGVGIPAQDLPHVFEWFYRAENVAGTVSGTGIGLAGARQIVEQHGGTIDVESQVGIGSTFTLRLPMSPAGEPIAETSTD